MGSLTKYAYTPAMENVFRKVLSGDRLADYTTAAGGLGALGGSIFGGDAEGSSDNSALRGLSTGLGSVGGMVGGGTLGFGAGMAANSVLERLAAALGMMKNRGGKLGFAGKVISEAKHAIPLATTLAGGIYGLGRGAKAGLQGT